MRARIDEPPQSGAYFLYGGPNAAKYVLHNSAENFAEVSLELGGKSPFIVFEDADIESAVNGSIAGIFGATGQSCVAGSRLYLHEDIAEEFLARMIPLAKSISIGDPLEEDTQMGPLCTTGQMRCVEEEVARAIAEGGTVLCGGKRPDGMAGNYYEPTIVECPRQDMHIVDTEMFGPVLSVLRFKVRRKSLNSLMILSMVLLLEYSPRTARVRSVSPKRCMLGSSGSIHTASYLR